jgi:hypothetical protein
MNLGNNLALGLLVVAVAAGPFATIAVAKNTHVSTQKMGTDCASRALALTNLISRTAVRDTSSGSSDGGPARVSMHSLSTGKLLIEAQTPLSGNVVYFHRILVLPGSYTAGDIVAGDEHQNIEMNDVGEFHYNIFCGDADDTSICSEYSSRARQPQSLETLEVTFANFGDADAVGSAMKSLVRQCVFKP